MVDYVIYLIVFLSVVCVVWWISSIVASSKSDTEVNQIPILFRMFSAGIFFFSIEGGGILENMFRERSKKTKQMLEKADIPMEVREIYGAQMLFFLLGVAVGGCVGFSCPIPLPAKFLMAFVFAAVGAYYPIIYIEKLARERTEEILQALPFSIDLISSSMNAGLDFGAAVRYLLATGENDVLRREFGIFLRDVELGKTRTEALQDMEKRVSVTEFTRFVSAVSYGMDSGSSVIDIMRVQAEEMRRVKFARAEQEASKAPSKMIIPMALFIFPAMFIIIFVPIFLRVKDTGIFSAIGK